MDIVLLLSVALGLLFYLLIHFAAKWVGSILGKRMAARALKQLMGENKPAALIPESNFSVVFDDAQITCLRPDGSHERVTWEDLQKIEIITTDDGPIAPDIFWLLHGTNSGCVIPQGAKGHIELLEKLQELPAFDNEAVIHAMGSTSNASFVCWVCPSSSLPAESQPIS
jgi:hypothetical protein